MVVVVTIVDEGGQRKANIVYLRPLKILVKSVEA